MKPEAQMCLFLHWDTMTVEANMLQKNCWQKTFLRPTDIGNCWGASESGVFLIWALMHVYEPTQSVCYHSNWGHTSLTLRTCEWTTPSVNDIYWLMQTPRGRVGFKCSQTSRWIIDSGVNVMLALKIIYRKKQKNPSLFWCANYETQWLCSKTSELSCCLSPT